MLEHQRKLKSRKFSQYAITLKNAISKKQRAKASFNERFGNSEGKDFSQAVLEGDELPNEEEAKVRLYT